MAMKVYGIPMSTATARVLIVLYELDVEFELVPVDLKSGEQKKAEYKLIQPFGTIPAIQDGDLTIFESRAIIRYLANKFEGKTSLYGTTPEERALVEQWLEVEGQNYHPHVSTAVFQTFAPIFGMVGDPAIEETSLKKLETTLDIYEIHLAKNKYLAGEFCSLADLSHLPHTYYLITASKRGDILEARPHVKRWWDDISSRPSWKKWVELSQSK